MSRRRVAIVQSSYVPWKGFFDLVAMVDEFVLYDSVQYVRHNWRNRNLIKTRRGPEWMTIPVRGRGRSRQRIREAEVADASWAARHLRTLEHHYAAAPHFEAHLDDLRALYAACAEEPRLTSVNELCIRQICAWLGIGTVISRDEDDGGDGLDRTERPLRVLRDRGAGELLSGPTAREYLDAERLESEGVAVRWMDYAGYPEHPQLHPPFVHGVTVLDLLFNTGPDAPRYMKFATRAAA